MWQDFFPTAHYFVGLVMQTEIQLLTDDLLVRGILFRKIRKRVIARKFTAIAL